MKVEFVGSELIAMGLLAQGNALYKGVFENSWHKAPEAIVTGGVVEFIGVLSSIDHNRKTIKQNSNVMASVASTELLIPLVINQYETVPIEPPTESHSLQII